MSFEHYITEEVFRLGSKKSKVSTYGHTLSLEIGPKSKFRSNRTVFINSADGVFELSAEEAVELGQQLVALGSKLLKEKASQPVPPPQPGRSALAAKKPPKKPKKN